MTRLIEPVLVVSAHFRCFQEEHLGSATVLHLKLLIAQLQLNLSGFAMEHQMLLVVESGPQVLGPAAG